VNILLTGATGFVGQAIAENLSAGKRFKVCGAVRQNSVKFPQGVRLVTVGDIDGSTQWNAALAGNEIVIHSAARAHIMKDSVADPLAEYRRVNVGGSLNLARQAIDAGVKRFIFISSIKVNGEGTLPGNPYTADDPPQPKDPYGISKMEAEQELRSLTRNSDMELVIIRPTLVYGPGVKANFLSMMRWLWRGIPLPFSLTRNKRSFVAVDNLVDLIVICLQSPAAANQTFLVSDGHDLSTNELLQAMGTALGRPARLFPFPVWLLSLCARMIGKPGIAHRLFGSLQVDISKTRTMLDWSPPVSVDVALKKTAADFIELKRKQ
jgi:nucleoside-diphosphate-sugar epimerase